MKFIAICVFSLVYFDRSLCRRSFCETRPDGYYQQGVCSEKFIRCQQGQTARYVCQYEDEIFDQQKNRCTLKASVPKCQNTYHQKTKNRAKIARDDSREAMGDFGYSDGSAGDSFYDGGEDSDNFCWQKEDGNYEVAPCIGTYIKCQNFRSIRYACREPGFIFSHDRGTCVTQASVPKCLSHQSSSLKQNCESSQLSEETAHQLWPCHSAFGLCNRGVFSAMSCRPGKVFDSSRGKCVSPAYNSECSGLEHQSSLGQFCEMYAETKYTRNYLVPYGACADRLVDCSRFPPSMVYCRPGEIFDAYHKQKCLPADQVAECGYK
uniref:Chitin-binding type-2 domain-containing protein n=1 Tax=Romanomermis culicivorax TaxID=13658 RepID=A0A915J156_ROMCU